MKHRGHFVGKKPFQVILCSLIVAGCAIVGGAQLYRALYTNQDALSDGLVPWASIGGCGAGGSGSGGASVKWVGKGVSGGLVDLQLIKSFSFGQNFSIDQYALRLSGKPTWTTSVGLNVPPIMSKLSEFQPTTANAPQTIKTGGFGDVSVDVSQTFGMAGQYSLNASLGIPVGQYDVKRGMDSDRKLLSSGLQYGSGIYSSSIGLSYTKDVEQGIWMFDLTYSQPFAMHLISGKNEFLDSGSYYHEFEDSTQNKRFYYRFKPYGENDLGDYSPPSVSLSAYYGYNQDRGYMHSFGVTFSVPTAVAWVHNENMRLDGSAIYKPRPDADHKAWSASLNYGMEMEHKKFPLFFAVTVPIHDKKTDTPDKLSSYSEWNGPDWKDFAKQWTLAVGVKTALFK